MELAKTVALLSEKIMAWRIKRYRHFKQQAKKDRKLQLIPHFCEMLDSERSYVRTRGIMLLADNAKWVQEKRWYIFCLSF